MVFIDINDPATLEALTCHEALALALDLSLDRIMIAYDCKSVVEEIKNGTEGRYSTIIKEIHSQSRDSSSYKFIFESRSLNFDAQNLTKFSSFLGGGRHLWMGLLPRPFVIHVNRASSNQ